MSTQQDIYAAGFENRPHMLNKENYVPWSSCLLRYAKSIPNGKLIYNYFINGPYVRRMIPEPGDANREVEADDQAIQTILLGLPEDIYAAVDKWSRHVTIVHQTKDLHIADYTQLYDFLKYNQKEIDELRAERLGKSHDPLALMANSNNPFTYTVFHQDQPSPSTYMQQPQANNNNSPQPSFNQNYMQQLMSNPEDISDMKTTMNMALVLVAKNSNGNGNAVAARAEGNAAGNNEVDNTAKTRRPQPRSNTKNDRVPSASKNSCSKNKEVEVEEHPRNLLLSKNKKHMSSEWNLKLLINFVWKFLGTVRFGNDHVVVILDFSDLQWGNILITRVYFVKGLGHNLFSVGQFYDSDLERITILLQSPVIIIRTDNGTKFKNQILKEYSDSVDISHQASSIRTPKQNGVVERRNQTLVEAARTMLIFSRAPLFLWAERIATAKPNISFLHVFGPLCYPKNDHEDIGKLGAKATLRIDPAAQAPQVRQTLMTSTTIADTAPTPKNSSSQATNIPNTSHDVDGLETQQQHAQQQEN
uniref:Retrovirus-related Pol polyprotein from transposon TNT 1-94 n=1 Tax=Tanacetum cinerariifolium TaxID=118510 RepID=A0A6L2ND46_TANCI|nr:retrovirus-related Pol polyprotein from transposon TNT 1-94 [Tanacetum cinerariifolium]